MLASWSKTSDAKLGPIALAEGVSVWNALSMQLGAFLIAVLVPFLNFVQPYLLTEHLGIPQEQQGQIVGDLGFYTEIVILLMSGLVGALSDQVGRRVIYAVGIAVMALSLVLYPLASGYWELVLYRLVFAAGAAMRTLITAAAVSTALMFSAGPSFAEQELLKEAPGADKHKLGQSSGFEGREAELGEAIAALVKEMSGGDVDVGERDGELGQYVAVALKTIRHTSTAYPHRLNDALVKQTLGYFQFAKDNDLMEEMRARSLKSDSPMTLTEVFCPGGPARRDRRSRFAPKPNFRVHKGLKNRVFPILE